MVLSDALRSVVWDNKRFHSRPPLCLASIGAQLLTQAAPILGHVDAVLVVDIQYHRMGDVTGNRSERNCIRQEDSDPEPPSTRRGNARFAGHMINIVGSSSLLVGKPSRTETGSSSCICDVAAADELTVDSSARECSDLTVRP